MDSGCVAPLGVLPREVGRARRNVGEEAPVCPGVSCFLEPKPRVEGSAGGLSLYLKEREGEAARVGSGRGTRQTDREKDNGESATSHGAIESRTAPVVSQCPGNKAMPRCALPWPTEAGSCGP